jgi:hypothetical protein
MFVGVTTSGFSCGITISLSCSMSDRRQMDLSDHLATDGTAMELYRWCRWIIVAWVDDVDPRGRRG